jgi:pimeloyl-ACP methyl ester carboxylesterase
MIPPASLTLGTGRMSTPPRAVVRGAEDGRDASGATGAEVGREVDGVEAASVAAILGDPGSDSMGRLVLELEFAALEAGQRHPVEYELFWPKRNGRPLEVASARGVTLVIPGILGRESAHRLVLALAEDGWVVAVAWPPLVDRVREAWEAHDAVGARERGAAVGRVVDRAVRATAAVFGLALPSLVELAPALEGKPVVLVGESLGAILGVGVAASGRIPFDAAVFIAGGGGFCDIVRDTAIRGFVFGARDFDDPEFLAGFAGSCRSDPLRAAERLRGGPVVFISAEEDLIVPTSTQNALWHALGEPPRYRWTGGHLSLFSLSPWTIVPALREVVDAIGPATTAYDRVFGVSRRGSEAAEGPGAGVDGGDGVGGAGSDAGSGGVSGERFGEHPGAGSGESSGESSGVSRGGSSGDASGETRVEPGGGDTAEDW